MSTRILKLSCIIFLFCYNFSVIAVEKELFNFGWKFNKTEIEASSSAYNDTNWRKIDLPHDFSIENIADMNTPFTKTALSNVNSGFTVGGTAWYRKKFTPSSKLMGKTVYLYFEGIYRNCTIWMNGKILSTHKYGYTPFRVDITNAIEFRKPNIIAIKIENNGVNCRWYSGSGIYRHVWLESYNSVHIVPDGTFITTDKPHKQAVMVHQQTVVRNQSNFEQKITLVTSIRKCNNLEIAFCSTTQLVKPNSEQVFLQQIRIDNPDYWSTEAANLYKSVSTIITKKQVDSYTSTFGIRDISFSADSGFVLNGKTLKLKGGCVHHDNGILGSKAYDQAELRKVQLLKANGFNAIRTSHNPPTDAFLNACDSLGMLIIHETFDAWNDPKLPNDFSVDFKNEWEKELADIIKRDRNHPSVVMWSIGNEIPKMETEAVVNQAKEMASLVKSIDKTRPVTAGVHGFHDFTKEEFFDALDVSGYNYEVCGPKWGSYLEAHKRNPKRIMYGSESYPMDLPQIWENTMKYPWVIGDFVWTAFDYLGESSVGWHGYPQLSSIFSWNTAYCGDLDICGNKRPQSYLRDMVWENSKPIAMFVAPPVSEFQAPGKREDWSRWHFDELWADWSWTGQENKELQVVVFSRADSVELLLNGTTLGRKAGGKQHAFRSTFSVPYQSGVLIAKAVIDGKIFTDTLKSYGQPASINLSPEKTILKANGQDLCYVHVKIKDLENKQVYKATNRIRFEIQGAGSIIAAGNANPVCTNSFTDLYADAWHGSCMVIIKTGKTKGTIKLKAYSDNLPVALLTINCQ